VDGAIQPVFEDCNLEASSTCEFRKAGSAIDGMLGSGNSHGDVAADTSCGCAPYEIVYANLT
jgi:hypothetical protein